MEYYESSSAYKPMLVEVTSTHAYLRRNIKDMSEGDLVLYTYEEACMTIEQFNAYANKNLMSGQETSENNQLAIMEAFVDMYETMAMALEGG